MPVISDGAGGQPGIEPLLVGTARRLAALTALSRLAGLARDAAIGAVFGAGPVADSFFVAFRVPNFFRRVVAEGAVSTALVPLLTRALDQRGREGALRIAGAAGSAAALFLALCCALAMGGASEVISVFAPGFDAGERHALASWLFFWTMPYVFLAGMAAWATAVLHTFRMFVAPALGPVLFNLSVVAAALLLPTRLETPVAALVAGVLAGGALHLLVQVPGLRSVGLRPWRHAGFAGARAGARGWTATAAALAGGSIHQVNVLVGTVVASSLGEGAVSWLWYADRLLEFPLGIVAVAVGTAALPSLAQLAGAGRHEELARTVEEALRLALAFSLPAAVGLWLLADDVTSLLLERGRFDMLDSSRTAEALVACAPGLVGIAIVKVLAPTYQVLGRARVAVGCAAASAAWNLLFGLWLAGPFERTGGNLAPALFFVSKRIGGAGLGHAGVAAASGTAALLQALLSLGLLARVLPAWRPQALAAEVLRQAAACSLMVAAVAGWNATSQWAGLESGGPARTLGAIGAGGLAYLVGALALGSREVASVLGLSRRWPKRSTSPQRRG